MHGDTNSNNGSSGAGGLLSHLAQLDKAAHVVTRPHHHSNTDDATHATTLQQQQHSKPPALSEAASTLPRHIIAITDVRKLNAQVPFFRCPAWADVPSRAYHLHCTRGAATLPSLGLHRFAYYLLGKAAVCDYVLEHPSISSVHAALVFHAQQQCFVVVDMNSTNGVRVDGQRIARQKPMPMPVGTTLQLGYSTRRYELRMGAPRHVDSDASGATAAAAAAATRTHAHIDEQQHQSTTTCAVDVSSSSSSSLPLRKRTRDTDDDDDVKATTAATTVSDAAANATQTTATQTTASSSQPQHDDHTAAATVAGADAAQPRRIHLYQLVIKHKDVDKPVSRGRNKGEAITRSRDDALGIVHFIVRTHAQQHAKATAATATTTARHDSRRSDAFVAWTVDEFVHVVQQYCEAASAKKQGDLGMVSEGTYNEAVERVAFALRRGEVSAPVETPLGIHLFYRCD